MKQKAIVIAKFCVICKEFEMSVDEYCEICGKSAKQALETQSEREKELIRNAFDFGRAVAE